MVSSITSFVEQALFQALVSVPVCGCIIQNPIPTGHSRAVFPSSSHARLIFLHVKQPEASVCSFCSTERTRELRTSLSRLTWRIHPEYRVPAQQGRKKERKKFFFFFFPKVVETILGKKRCFSSCDLLPDQVLDHLPIPQRNRLSPERSTGLPSSFTAKACSYAHILTSANPSAHHRARKHPGQNL